jgi:hypothetical protein
MKWERRKENCLMSKPMSTTKYWWGQPLLPKQLQSQQLKELRTSPNLTCQASLPVHPVSNICDSNKNTTVSSIKANNKSPNTNEQTKIWMWCYQSWWAKALTSQQHLWFKQLAVARDAIFAVKSKVNLSVNLFAAVAIIKSASAKPHWFSKQQYGTSAWGSLTIKTLC